MKMNGNGNGSRRIRGRTSSSRSCKTGQRIGGSVMHSTSKAREGREAMDVWCCAVMIASWLDGGSLNEVGSSPWSIMYQIPL